MSVIRISVPGQPTRYVDLDPLSGLTPRQRRVLEVVRAHGGNRSRAARELGVTTTTVQTSLRLIAERGIRVPATARRGRDLGPRVRR